MSSVASSGPVHDEAGVAVPHGVGMVEMNAVRVEAQRRVAEGQRGVRRDRAAPGRIGRSRVRRWRLLEADARFDMIGGTSAGVVNAVAIGAG